MPRATLRAQVIRHYTLSVDDQRTRTQQDVVQRGHVDPVGAFAADDEVPYAALEVFSRSQRTAGRRVCTIIVYEI